LPIGGNATVSCLANRFPETVLKKSEKVCGARTLWWARTGFERWRGG
jgi:hypothetical protein